MTDEALVKPPSDDGVMVAACLAGDARAMRSLYETHHAAVRRMVQLAAPDGVVVEDLVHDTFVRALERLGSFRGDAPLSVWLRGIALNLTRTERDRRRCRKRLLDARAPVEAGDPEAQAASRLALERLRRLLLRLSDDEREAFVLRRIENLSLQQVVAITGVADSTISDRVRRAADKLERWMKEER